MAFLCFGGLNEVNVCSSFKIRVFKKVPEAVFLKSNRVKTLQTGMDGRLVSVLQIRGYKEPHRGQQDLFVLVKFKFGVPKQFEA